MTSCVGLDPKPPRTGISFGDGVIRRAARTDQLLSKSKGRSTQSGARSGCRARRLINVLVVGLRYTQRPSKQELGSAVTALAVLDGR